MPREKREGQTQLSVQVPDELVVAMDAKRGTRSRNAYICDRIADDTGVPYVPNAVGRPRKDAKKKPAPKKPARKKK